jgi:branched-chain amino acid transport system ATP-binding protein
VTTVPNDLTITGLNSYYGRAHALFDVDLTVQAGTTFAILGRNGAGKTSLLRSIASAGITAKGTISYAGTVITGRPAPDIARLGVQLVPDDRRIFTQLTVAQNLRLGEAATTPERPAIPVDRILTFFPLLVPLLDRGGYQLSGGEQQLLAIARAMVANPSLLLLDEPSEGLAPRIVEQVGQAIEELRREFALTVVMAEQNSAFAMSLARNVCVLEGGRVVHACTASEFQQDAELRRRFLTV